MDKRNRLATEMPLLSASLQKLSFLSACLGVHRRPKTAFGFSHFSPAAIPRNWFPK
ncbi:MAG: hypothetical protein KIT18_16270 [Burkholderiales bacterium]|nr:hypothetical protein [Burkholderiales bacterium]